MDGLDASQIRLAGAQVRVLERCSSTNALLLESDLERPTLLACEEQTAGRGRRGRLDPPPAPPWGGAAGRPRPRRPPLVQRAWPQHYLLARHPGSPAAARA